MARSRVLSLWVPVVLWAGVIFTQPVPNSLSTIASATTGIVRPVSGRAIVLPTIEVSEAKRLRQLEDENAKLKKLLLSSTAVGGSFTPAIVTVTVAVSVPPLPSETV
mgnify:CR=1 FL=1